MGGALVYVASMFLFPKSASAKGLSVSSTSKGVIIKNVLSIYAIVLFVFLVLELLLGLVNADSTPLGGTLLCLVEASNFLLPIVGTIVVTKMI